MAKKKKISKPKVKFDKEKLKLFRSYYSTQYGMTAYNAARKAQFSVKESMLIAKQNDPLAIYDENGKWDIDKVVENMYEQEGYTKRLAIRRMVRKAGMLEEDGTPGAQKVISAQVVIKSDNPDVKPIKANSRTNDFVEVDDEDIQIKYLKDLNKMSGLVDNEKATEKDPTNASKPYNITIQIMSDKPAEGKGNGGNGGGVEVRTI